MRIIFFLLVLPFIAPLAALVVAFIRGAIATICD